MMQRSAYDAGLSYFPDDPRYPGTARGLGALGNATDDARQARADYFGQLAVLGNVAAARIVLGGTQNTSGNEQPDWFGWVDAMKGTPLGLQTFQAAYNLGAWWPVGSSDTVDNYPIMKKFVADWAKANPGPAPAILPPPPPPAPLPLPAALPPSQSPQQLPPPPAAMQESGLQLGGVAISPTMLVIGLAGVAALTFLSRRR
jgi:hypothetical protein